MFHFFFVSLQLEMKRFVTYCAAFSALICIMIGCNRATDANKINLSLRARVDRYNKEAFLNRYHDPNCGIVEAYDALKLVKDSLPNYYDGRLRAYNNLAFNYYILAEHDSAEVYLDSVIHLADSHAIRLRSNNYEVESLIANLMRIRLLQRSCKIADSYLLLYNIDHSRVLKHEPDNYLYSYAQMEYYITSLTLNYHYRNEAVTSSSGTLLNTNTKQNMRELLQEIEEIRPSLRCDYTEDLALNYALAHSFYRLASVSKNSPELLRKSYHYLIQNARILGLKDHYSNYHLANVFQLQAFIAADTNINPEIYYQRCGREMRVLDSLCQQIYPTDSLYLQEDYGLEMFHISTDLFFQTPDPYQHLGAVVAAAEYCLSIGEYDMARDYYSLILDDTTWHDNMAPKFEAMLYDGLIRMGYSPLAEDNIAWYSREAELINFIRKNESADVMLQDRLDHSETRNRFYLITIFTILPFLAVLSLLVVLLVNRSKRLRQEKTALQEAKRQDVERIANVETCLSVMRHDINPFLSYLQNKKLTPEMRQEVLDQLLRTFSNIKNWTNLSIPSGLIFRPTHFSLNDVFASVASTCINVHKNVKLTFVPNDIRIFGDTQLTEILIRNLVNNALQHTDEGEVTVSATCEDNQFAHIVVADTGCGMDDQTIENLFRADKKINSEGDNSHGFGLILCKYIIKRHDDNTLRGCRIWAESQVGKGSKMHVMLALSDKK